MITEFILKQKTHIIYGVIILLLSSLTYYFFKKTPETITKTITKVETQIKTVEKVVTRDRIVYRDRTITIHKKNGDVIVERDHEHSNTVSKNDTLANTTTKTQVTDKTVESFMKNYSVEALFPIVNNSLSINTNPLDTQVILGMRLFGTPLFLQGGTNMHFNQALIGIRTEF